MALIYFSAQQHFNERKYKINQPAYYATQAAQSKAIYTDGIKPIYEPIVPEAKVYAMVPICDMVDMAISRVPFQILQDRDVVEILHMIDNYLLEVRVPIESGNGVFVRYAHNVIILREQIFKIFRSVMHRHKDWRAKYEMGSSAVRKFFELMSLNLGPQFSVDPIMNLRHPPFKIPELNGPTVVLEKQRDPTTLEKLTATEKVRYTFHA